MKDTEYKKTLRRELKFGRKQMPEEQRLALSDGIAQRFLSCDVYRNCDTLLCFVSTGIEVDTTRIIETAFSDGKRVAVPRCVPGTRDMDFCVISSLSELVSGAYGIPEPPSGCEVINGGGHSVCIVPGLAYDISGYRLGFGGGYYDRFLPGFRGVSCGVCYEGFILKKLPREDCDVAVDMLITEERILDL